MIPCSEWDKSSYWILLKYPDTTCAHLKNALQSYTLLVFVCKPGNQPGISKHTSDPIKLFSTPNLASNLLKNQKKLTIINIIHISIIEQHWFQILQISVKKSVIHSQGPIAWLLMYHRQCRAFIKYYNLQVHVKAYMYMPSGKFPDSTASHAHITCIIIHN